MEIKCKEKSEKTKEKMSLAKKGALNPNWNKHHSEETKRKISQGCAKHHQNLASSKEIEQKCIYEIKLPFEIQEDNISRSLVRNNDIAGLYANHNPSGIVVNYSILKFRPHQKVGEWITFTYFNDALACLNGLESRKVTTIIVNESGFRRILSLLADDFARTYIE